MIAAIADTHAPIWHLFGDSRLSASAGTAILEAANARKNVGISTISLVEIVYLVEKGRLPEAAWVDLRDALDDPDHVFVETGLTGAVVDAMKEISRAEVPDMPDRIIAATAVHLGVPVISRDRRILAANLNSIW